MLLFGAVDVEVDSTGRCGERMACAITDLGGDICRVPDLSVPAVDGVVDYQAVSKEFQRYLAADVSELIYRK